MIRHAILDMGQDFCTDCQLLLSLSLGRVAGHICMKFKQELNSGGADGCIDFQDPDNFGLNWLHVVSLGSVRR